MALALEWKTPVYVGGAPSEALRLVWAYKRYRRMSVKTPRGAETMQRAANALHLARTDAQGGVVRFPSPGFIQYCAPSDDGLRWIENVESGLRFVDYADKLANLRHSGWYTYEGGDPAETMRGVVYRLPGLRFVAGYDEGESTRKGWRPLNPGGARLDMRHTYTCEIEAARAADRIAERCAEESREHNEAWQAAQRCEELRDEAKAARQEALAILRERRAMRAHAGLAPTICARLRGDVSSLLGEARKARKEIAELVDRFGDNPSFSES